MSDITPHILGKRIGETPDVVRRWLNENEEFRKFCGAYRNPGGHWRIKDVTREQYSDWCQRQTEDELYGLDDCSNL